MAIFAAAKSSFLTEFADDLRAFFASLSPAAIAAENVDGDGLEAFFAPPSVALIRNVMKSIPFQAHDPTNRDVVVTMAIRPSAWPINPAYAFCMAVLFVSLRELSGFKKASNPTWTHATRAQVSFSGDDLVTTLRRRASEMLANVDEFYANASQAKPTHSITGDVKSLPLQTESIDRFITSPPYLTRIDYAVSTSPELALLSDTSLLHRVRHATMGAPVITKQAKAQNPNWGALCNDILNSIAGHETKAASSYYWKNIVTYFMDLELALDEIFRSLKGGGSGLFVVQGSYFKEIEIPLGDIYVQMAQAKGFKANIAFREPVKNHMAHVNTKSSRYKTGKVYYEDAVYVKKA
jgi:hypothetical protein